ncbi:hypothetical protein FHY55_02400 [Oceanicola sp. D3]|uniref:hypothetical protein n=1 Tax=Oceanicola sp. D3 TaxID=2587163 RepID=UPI00112375DF|nr:hypothetical protein [Oceanicola sp. D3]QDC08163.1 hypothetical protein FHY55_02400 [Oceanicola sp. D3]
MTIRTIEDAGKHQFVVGIRQSGFWPRTQAFRLMDDLEAALPVLHRALDAANHYYFALDPTDGAWREEDSAFDPWASPHSLAIWKRLARTRDLHARLEAWLLEVERMMAFSLFDGMYESETCHFCEPLISTLALSNPRFVPHYARFMRHWDMSREQRQRDTIDQIVRRHGITPETEDLLFTRVVQAPGKTGEAQVEGLMDVLNRAYGDFMTSPLYRRIFDALNPPEPAEAPLPSAA